MLRLFIRNSIIQDNKDCFKGVFKRCAKLFNYAYFSYFFSSSTVNLSLSLQDKQIVQQGYYTVRGTAQYLLTCYTRLQTQHRAVRRRHCVGGGAPVNFGRRRRRAAGPKKSAAGAARPAKNIFF